MSKRKRYYSSTSDSEASLIILGIVILFVVLNISVNACVAMTTQEHITITVTEKERVVDGDESFYLVWTTRADDDSITSEVFENTDTIWFGKYNSSDVQGQLKEGRTYDVLVVGYRIPFFSAYRNIIRVE